MNERSGNRTQSRARARARVCVCDTVECYREQLLAGGQQGCVVNDMAVQICALKDAANTKKNDLLV